MPTVDDFVLKIEGICGGEVNSVAVLRPEKVEQGIAWILSRGIIKKKVSGYMWEIRFLSVTFRVFKSGRVVFRGIEKDELGRFLEALFM